MLRWFGKKRVGLALGGGAARGLAHIGVLQALEEAEVPVDLITGTSMGAIIGAMYAANPQIDPLHDRLIEYLQSDIFRKARLDFVVERKDKVDGEGLFFRFSQLARRKIFFTLAMTMISFVSQDTRDKSFEFLLPDINIEDTKLPFAAIALDLISCKEVIIKNGSLRTAIAATSALPGILPPVDFREMQLVDGGWIDAVPVQPAKEMGADIVIAVDVGSDLGGTGESSSGLDVVFRADAAARNALSNLQLQQADLVICPSVGITHWADFSRADEIIANGRYATLQLLPEIKALLKLKETDRKKRFFKS
jgi:NTE family protein